ncbi:MAG: hypothetical protein Q9212_002525 [Teloschistes hypoglaucus]
MPKPEHVDLPSPSPLLSNKSKNSSSGSAPAVGKAKKKGDWKDDKGLEHTFCISYRKAYAGEYKVSQEASEEKACQIDRLIANGLRVRCLIPEHLHDQYHDHLIKENTVLKAMMMIPTVDEVAGAVVRALEMIVRITTTTRMAIKTRTSLSRTVKVGQVGEQDQKATESEQQPGQILGGATGEG